MRLGAPGPGCGFLHGIHGLKRRERLAQVHRQVVDAHMLYPGHHEFGRRAAGQPGHRQPLTGRGAAQRAAPVPLLGLRLACLGHQPGVTIGLDAVGKTVGAGRVVHLACLTLPAAFQRHAGGERTAGLVIIAVQRQALGTQTTPAAQCLHGVIGLGGIGTVEAHPATGLRHRVLRLRGGIGKQHQHVATGILPTIFHPPAQAFFGQQALEEGQVGLAILHAVAARSRALEKIRGFPAPAPLQLAGVVAQYGVDDLLHVHVLEHAAVMAMLQPATGVPQHHAVTGQAAIVGQQVRFGDQAMPGQPATIGQPGLQAGSIAQPLLQGQVGIERQQQHLVAEPVRELFFTLPAVHQHHRRIRQLHPVQTFPIQQPGRLCHQVPHCFHGSPWLARHRRCRCRFHPL